MFVKKLRVLVADDDCVIANTFAQIMKLSGHDAETVNSGEDAIEAARRHKPDVLISDVVMGGITGIEAAVRILEMHPECVVILISGQANTADLLDRDGGREHQFEILTKPIHPEAILDRIAASTRNRASGGIQPSFRAAVNY